MGIAFLTTFLPFIYHKHLLYIYITYIVLFHLHSEQTLLEWPSH